MPEGSASFAPIAKAEEQWVSFTGPDGGDGWVNMSTGEKRYQKERPGEGVEDFEEDDMAEGWSEPPEDPSELQVGQTLEYVDPGGDHVEGEVVRFNEDGNAIAEDAHGGGDWVVDEYTYDSVTAVGEVGEYHPDDPDIALEPSAVDGEVPDWATDYEPGQTVTLDTSMVGPMDDTYEAEIAGWANADNAEEHGYMIPTPDDIPAEMDYMRITEENIL